MERATAEGEAVDEPVDGTDKPVERAGEQALRLLSTPLQLNILRALAPGPMRLAELRQATGLPAQTTLRGHLTTLERTGALKKRPAQQTPYAVESELTAMGRDLLRAARVLESWLRSAPDGPIALESESAKGTVKAFVDGWGSTMMRGLALRPMSLTELDRSISALTYPALERRLSSMRMARLVQPQPGAGAGTPYEVTDWARRGVAPLAAAGHCERLHLGARAAPVTQIDVEAAFLLATPLAELPEEVDGECQLAVEPEPGEEDERAGVRIALTRGRVVFCDCGLRPRARNQISGTPRAWYKAVRDGSFEGLRFEGDRRLSEAVIIGLHAAVVSRS